MLFIVIVLAILIDNSITVLPHIWNNSGYLNFFDKLRLVLVFIKNRVATWSGNQEKSGKTEKNDKSQVKIGFFEKSQEKVRNFFLKPSDFVSSTLLNFKSL